MNVFLAFITGLTTGGLSCLAVQGGLLASSLASQIEGDLQSGGRTKKGTSARSAKPRLAQPILVFLAAKLAAYTLLGFLLGLVGSMFQLSPLTRAALQIAIGIFMLGSALRMLNVHPIFRVFAFEPPAFLRRRIRKTAASSGSSLVTPVFLGLLTVLIPCGITQAMMAAALSTADPVQGAALMFAFTLGTSPVFFAVAYFATQLGSRLEKHFMRFVAVVVLILGVVAIDTGLTLAGSPVSLTRLMNGAVSQPMRAEASVPTQAAEAETVPQGESQPTLQAYDPNATGPALATPTEASQAAGVDENVITIEITNSGYDPEVLHAKAGVPLKLRLVSQDVYSCALAFVIPGLNFQQFLEPTGEVLVDIPPQQAGTRMPFSCSMGMFTGDIVFDL